MDRTELEAAYEAELNARGVDPFLQGILTDADRLRLWDDRQLERNILQLQHIRATNKEQGTQNFSTGLQGFGAGHRQKEGANVTARV